MSTDLKRKEKKKKKINNDLAILAMS